MTEIDSQKKVASSSCLDVDVQLDDLARLDVDVHHRHRASTSTFSWTISPALLFLDHVATKLISTTSSADNDDDVVDVVV